MYLHIVYMYVYLLHMRTCKYRNVRPLDDTYILTLNWLQYPMARTVYIHYNPKGTRRLDWQAEGMYVLLCTLFG